MAKYRALQDGLIGTHYVRAGEVFEYSGKAPSWGEPLKPEGGKTAPEKKG